MIPMKLYRIYTEDVNSERIGIMVSRVFPGFTTYRASGWWKGHNENSLVIEIIVPAEDGYESIRSIASLIKTMNRQDSVLITVQDVESELV